MSAPQAVAQRATMSRPRPKVISGLSSPGAVADLDPRVLGGSAHPHPDRRNAVQDGVADQLGDPQLGALGQVVSTDLGARFDHPASGLVHPTRARAQGEDRSVNRHSEMPP
jgi:hypothetical protein